MRFSLLSGVALLLTTASLTAAAPIGKSKLSADDILNIRDTIAEYAFAVDEKRFSSLGNVFTNDVNGDFALGSPLVGLSAVQQTLGSALTGKQSQHAMSSTTIDSTAKNQATSKSYFTATFVGQGPLAGQIATAYGIYEDVWVKDGKATWLINKRKLTYITINGNLNILS